MVDYKSLLASIAGATGKLAEFKTSYTKAKPTKIANDPVRAFLGVISDYRKAGSELASVPTADQNTPGYKKSKAEAESLGKQIRTFAKNLLQANVEGVEGYTSGLKKQVDYESGARRRIGIPMLRPSGKAVSNSLEYGKEMVDGARTAVIAIHEALDDAKLTDAPDAAYVNELNRRLTTAGRALDKKETEHKTNVTRDTERLTDKEWDKVAKRVKKLTGY